MAECIAFKKYPAFLELESHHGVDFGSTYTNRQSAHIFTHFIAKGQQQMYINGLSKVSFVSFLMDGSTTDAGNVEDELIVLLHSMKDDAKEMVRTVTRFFAVEVPTKADSDGLIRLELACKDALCSDLFTVIDEMLLRLYYIYEKSPQICRELTDIADDLKECTQRYCETEDGSVYKPGKTWADKSDPCVKHTCESMPDGSAEVLTSFESCASIVCSNGKPGYKLPGQCCESCNFDIGFDTTSNMAIGTSGVATPTILQPTWGEWGNWTECSRACGGGRQSRVRECLNEGRTSINCTGNRVEVRTCNTQCCPVNGGFASWSGWSNCSVTCGSGIQYRTRSCSNPAPACGGSLCVGAALDLRACVMTPCPADIDWIPGITLPTAFTPSGGDVNDDQ
ncbi:hypothetical protein EMCRGX_G031068 [Ephydatia muelleri]